VRAAHCARVEAHTRSHLFDSTLSPQRIADACGISLRYLHTVVSGEGQTVAEMIRARRLHAAHARLGVAGPLTSNAQVALANGFGDQAQFRRQFCQHYGLTSIDYLRHRRLS
jgi:AraC-like DNA-binding protein